MKAFVQLITASLLVFGAVIAKANEQQVRRVKGTFCGSIIIKHDYDLVDNPDRLLEYIKRETYGANLLVYRIDGMPNGQAVLIGPFEFSFDDENPWGHNRTPGVRMQPNRDMENVCLSVVGTLDERSTWQKFKDSFKKNSGAR